MSKRGRFLMLIFMIIVMASLLTVSLVSCDLPNAYDDDSSYSNVNDKVDVSIENNTTSSIPSVVIKEEIENNVDDDRNETNEPSLDENTNSNDNNSRLEDKENENNIADDDLLVMDFLKLNSRYTELIAPIKNAIEVIFNDLIDNGYLNLTGCDNWRITSLRYFNGLSLEIFYEFDVYIFDDMFATEGEKSDILICEHSVSLENFSDWYGESFCAYRDFLREMKRYADLQNVDNVKPMAETVAENILNDYSVYEGSVEVIKYGKHIELNPDGRYASEYKLIESKLNAVLAYKKYDAYPYHNQSEFASIDGETITIDFGKMRNDDDSYTYHVCFVVTKSVLKYSIYVEISDIWEWLIYFTGTLEAGYTPKNPNWFNPPNEAFDEFFDCLLGLDMDFENATFDCTADEDSFMYF